MQVNFQTQKVIRLFVLISITIITLSGCQQNNSAFPTSKTPNQDMGKTTQNPTAYEFVSNDFINKIISQIPANHIKFNSVGTDTYITPQNRDENHKSWKAISSKPCESKQDPTDVATCYTQLTIWNEENYSGTLETYLQKAYPFSEFKNANGRFAGEKLTQKINQDGTTLISTPASSAYGFNTGGDAPTIKEYVFFLKDQTIVRANLSYYSYEKGSRTAKPPKKVAAIVNLYDGILTNMVSTK